MFARGLKAVSYAGAVLRQSGVERKYADPLVDAGIGYERSLLTLGSVGRAMHPANASVHEAVREPNVVLPIKAEELVCAHAGPLELSTPGGDDDLLGDARCAGASVRRITGPDAAQQVRLDDRRPDIRAAVTA